MPQTQCLVAYSSRKGENYLDGRIVNLPIGNTEHAAKAVQSLCGADIFEIRTARAYPTGYPETTEEAQRELKRDAHPKLAEPPASLAGCEVVVLGYPNWWRTLPRAVCTFLEAHDFSGKTLLLFCTHEGSGLGRSERDIQKLCPGARVMKGLAIRGGSAQKAEGSIAAWLKSSQVIS